MELEIDIITFNQKHALLYSVLNGKWNFLTFPECSLGALRVNNKIFKNVFLGI